MLVREGSFIIAVFTCCWNECTVLNSMTHFLFLRLQDYWLYLLRYFSICHNIIASGTGFLSKQSYPLGFKTEKQKFIYSLYLILQEIAFFYSIIDTFRIYLVSNTRRSPRTEFVLRRQSDDCESNTNFIPSSWIKPLAPFRPWVNPIIFFDSRLLAGTHTRLPSDRSVESYSRRSWRHEGRMYVRSFDLEK